MDVVTPIKHPLVAEAERLEGEICALAGRLAAATCRFLLLIAEFDRIDGWAGHRSCAHWLSWRCSLSASAAREHVRIARALTEWPLIRETFAAGRLSYSKVRAITRVVTPGNEAELIQTALVTTASQLDRITQAMRTATRQQVRDRHHRRTLTWRWDDDGMLVLNLRLDPDEGAVTLAALRAAQSPDPNPAHDATQPEKTRPDDPPSPPGADESASAGSAERRTAAPDRASAEARPTRDPVDPVDPVDPRECPATRDSQRPGMTLVDSFCTIVTSYLGAAARDATDPDVFQIMVLTDAATPSGKDSTGTGEDATGDDGTAGGVTDEGIALPRDTIARIACTAAVIQAKVRPDGTPMDVGRKTRKVNASLRRALRIRDAGSCRFPGCTARRRLHAHHLQHWADGGRTTLANLISLCPAHHWAVHEGGYNTWVDESHRLRFARPDGRPLHPAPGIGPAEPDLTADEQLSPDKIAPDRIVPDWDGTPLDLDNAVFALLQPAYDKPPSAPQPDSAPQSAA